MAKMTPAQGAGAFAATMVYALTTAAIALNWPDSSPWILRGITALFILGILLWGYRLSRKPDPPGTTDNVTPTERAVGALLIAVILAGGVIALVWPDRPSWVSWVQMVLLIGCSYVFYCLQSGAKDNPACLKE